MNSKYLDSTELLKYFQSREWEVTHLHCVSFLKFKPFQAHLPKLFSRTHEKIKSVLSPSEG